jgi:NADPH:quinone reductase-like Zn-dependent oxidoreductase
LPSNPGELAAELLYRSITVHYEFMGTRVAYDVEPARQGAILTAIARLIDRGLLRVHVAKRLPLAEVAEGHRLIETERTIGKIAIVVAGA